MTSHAYLLKVLESQRIVPGSAELNALTTAQKEVEEIIRASFKDSNPVICPGGSLAKGTMIKESYDLDIICYFPKSDDEPGDTLKEIYESVATALSDKYTVRRKRSALRLFDKDTDTNDFHIDVVPGRYVDGTQGDCFIHQHEGDKVYLKTNLQKHITHIRNSGVTDAISLLKLWKVRNSIPVKTFVLELLVVEALKDHKNDTLNGQLEHVFSLLRDQEIATVTDPANASNDLSDRFDSSMRSRLATEAKKTLEAINNKGWESVYGAVSSDDGAKKIGILSRAAKSDESFTRPWHS